MTLASGSMPRSSLIASFPPIPPCMVRSMITTSNGLPASFAFLYKSIASIPSLPWLRLHHTLSGKASSRQCLSLSSHHPLQVPCHCQQIDPYYYCPFQRFFS